jgi:hypothetical protein
MVCVAEEEERAQLKSECALRKDTSTPTIPGSWKKLKQQVQMLQWAQYMTT